MSEIVWRDASGLGSDTFNSWFSTEEIKKLAEEQFNEVVYSVGFIVEKNDNFTVICGTKTGKEGEEGYCDCTMIPNIFIIKQN